MTAEELLRRDTADGLPAPLAALWWQARGSWDRAHELVKSVGTADAAWVHAHLHRQEGDLKNAGHWYRRAGHRPSDLALHAEWTEIATALDKAFV